MTPDKIRKLADRAWQERRQYDVLLQDAYDYIIPYRSGGMYGTAAKGEARVDKVFDGTAPQAAMRFAGRVQADVTPPFQDFFALEAGPVAADRGLDKNELNKLLQTTTARVHGAVHTGRFHVASHEMYQDLFVGTGALLMDDGDDDDEIAKHISVPTHEIALSTDGWGRVTGIHWKKKFKCNDLGDLWPNGTFSADLKKAMAKESDRDVEVLQSTTYNRETKLWDLVVLECSIDKKAPPIHSRNYRTNPWLTPRFWVVPGEPYGRGPGLIALPFTKTVNKARELYLHAAAFALLGVHTYRDDGMFNPDTVQWSPGALIQVAANAGPQGPTLQSLNVPNRFDISQIVIADEREQMKIAMLDQTLPPDDGAVRSATEIAERMKRLSQDLGGAYARLALEVVVPLVRRHIDILHSRKALPTNLSIDQLLVALKVTSPIAQSQKANKVMPTVNWMTMIQSLVGAESLPMIAAVEKVFPDLGRDLGVSAEHIRSERDQQLLKAWVEKLATAKAEQMVAQMQADSAGAPAGNGMGLPA